jgi:hypothetical protein
VRQFIARRELPSGIPAKLGSDPDGEPCQEYAASDFDIRYNLVAASSYQLPDGSTRFQNPAARILGGWSLEAIFTAQA